MRNATVIDPVTKRSRPASATALAALSFVLTITVSPTRADVVPAGIFTDHMVLQREMPVPVWGTAAPGEEITVRLLDQKQTVTADKNGAWSVKLAPLTAGGPHELTIQGRNKMVLKDVLVGEVWLCSGQSNMAVSYGELISLDAKKQRQSPASRDVRFFNITGSQLKKADSTAWTSCEFDTAVPFSAVGVYFGRELQSHLKVPVGLINASWGSTPVQWFFAPCVDAERNVRVTEGGALYQRMVRQVRPYAIRGAIWYQGEANLGEAFDYRFLLPILVRSWRETWGQGEFPFLVAQQHSYGDATLMQRTAEMRESQRVAVRGMKNAGIAVTADHGGHKHPRDKEPVGIRLARVARAVAYGEDLVYEGPDFSKATVAGNQIRVQLKNPGGGLVVKNDRLTGFTIAGEDRQFVDAIAELDGMEIVVSSPHVAAPVAVRYGWSDPLQMSLYNREGLPAFPFRTDDFPLSTQVEK